MPNWKGKKESIALIDVITQSDKFIEAINRKTARSPATNALLMYQMSQSPLVSVEAKKKAREMSIRSSKKAIGRALARKLKKTFNLIS